VEPDLSNAELRGVARRPATGSLRNFLSDLKSLLNVRTLKATVQEFQRDDALGLAAQLAYYLILALFPFILVLVSLMGLVGSPELANTVLGYFRQVTPTEVYTLINEYTGDIISGQARAPGLLSFGILFTIWSASGAFSALINALNRAYDVQETRPFWKVKGIAILMTLGLSVLILAGVLLLVFGEPIGRAVANVFGLGEVFELAWNIVRWPVAFLFLVLTVALIYYFAPDVEQRFKWVSPGSIVAVIMWLLFSLVFSLYVNNFGGESYSASYGALAGVAILMLYIYYTSYILLLGAEMNQVIEEHIPEGKDEGEKTTNE